MIRNQNYNQGLASFPRGSHVLGNISNTRDSVSSGYPNTEKRVENKTGYSNFLYGCDFLCFNLMNYDQLLMSLRICFQLYNVSHDWFALHLSTYRFNTLSTVRYL